jgi:aryl carrier-like protein
MITKNLISISGGNDSIAMLQWVIENREHFPDEEFQALYVNTGWAISWWADRMLKVRDFCTANDIKYNETGADLGFEELVRKKGIFPNRMQKYCTFELKVKPSVKWRKENKMTPKNTQILTGVRADESARRSKYTSTDILDGYDTVNPIVYLSDDERNELVIRAGFKVLPHRSCECHPCIYEASKEKLRNIEPDRVELIANLEKDISDYTNAKRKLQKHPKYKPGEVFGMFNSAHLGEGTAGIKEQVKWAHTAPGKYLPGQEDMFCDDQFGYCGD